MSSNFVSLDDYERLAAEVERQGAVLAAVEVLLRDLNQPFRVGGPNGCGVCMGHSPSWDGHSRDCKRVFPERVAAALASAPEGDQPGTCITGRPRCPGCAAGCLFDAPEGDHAAHAAETVRVNAAGQAEVLQPASTAGARDDGATPPEHMETCS